MATSRLMAAAPSRCVASLSCGLEPRVRHFEVTLAVHVDDPWHVDCRHAGAALHQPCQERPHTMQAVALRGDRLVACPRAERVDPAGYARRLHRPRVKAANEAAVAALYPERRLV